MSEQKDRRDLRDGLSQAEPSRLSFQEQMMDAQAGCVPCKLCGGHAVISDAGYGAGYYIKCSGDLNFREHRGCLIDERRAGGWAYNVRDWWNRLHGPRDSDGSPERLDGAAATARAEGITEPKPASPYPPVGVEDR